LEHIGPGGVDVLVDVVVTFPPLLSRDDLKTSQANQIKSAAGVLSRQTWAEMDGLDWARENERIQSETEDDSMLGPNLGVFNDDDGDE
jgi:hypothetical protein